MWITHLCIVCKDCSGQVHQNMQLCKRSLFVHELVKMVNELDATRALAAVRSLISLGLSCLCAKYVYLLQVQKFTKSHSRSAFCTRSIHHWCLSSYIDFVWSGQVTVWKLVQTVQHARSTTAVFASIGCHNSFHLLHVNMSPHVRYTCGQGANIIRGQILFHLAQAIVWTLIKGRYCILEKI